MKALLIVSKPKFKDVFVDTERSYENEKVAVEELSFYENVLATKRIPLGEKEITEIPIATIPYRFFLKSDKLFFQIGLGRLWEEVLEKLSKKGIEIFNRFIALKLKEGLRFYEIGSIDGANIYLLIRR